MMFFPVPQETFDFSDFVGPFAEVEAIAEWTMPRTFAKVDEVAATSGDVAPSHPNQFEQLRDHVPHDICNQMAYDQDYGFYYVDRRAVRKYRYKMWRNPEHPPMWHLVKVPCTRDHRKKWVLCWDPKLATCASESEQVMSANALAWGRIFISGSRCGSTTKPLVGCMRTLMVKSITLVFRL